VCIYSALAGAPGGPQSIFSLGGLTQPATTLIEKISDAIGGIFKPYQIKRVAQAEAEAEKIKAIRQVELTDLHRKNKPTQAKEAWVGHPE
jgi:hypothetical protein